MKVLLIGGGDIRKEETKDIDKFAINVLDKNQPNILFIPAAANDHEGYIKSFKLYYESLGAKVSVAKLHSEHIADIITKIERSDAIYLSGGDPKVLMDKILELKLKKIFSEYKGLIIGYSAGAMVLGKFFNNSENIDNFKKNDITIFEGLNIVENTVIEPHFTKNNRKEFLLITSQDKCKLCGLDDNTALFIDLDKRQKIGEGNIFLGKNDVFDIKKGDNYE